MPHYYVHPKTRPYAEDDPDYLDRAYAFCRKGTEDVITFVADEEENIDFRMREGQRAREHRVPWYSSAVNGVTKDHYAYLSTDHPGYIGYTADLEAGILGKRKIMRPGRYLTTFLPEFASQHTEWIAICNVARMTLQIARTAEDICTVYAGGPGSCMAGGLQGAKADEYGWDHCAVPPVSVYGDSDLGIAYYGDINHVSARAIIWPDKQRYGRIYGADDVLGSLLRKEGYTSGSMVGARIKAISCCDGYLLPYVDGCEGAEDIGNGWLRLTRSESDYNTQNTNGCTGPIKQTQSCDHCGDAMNYDEDESYCYSCRDSQYMCDSCEHAYFEDAVHTEHHTLCENCASENERECQHPDCNESWYDIDIRSTTRRARVHNGTTDLCSACADLYRYCDACDSYYDVNEVCPDCAAPPPTPRCEQTTDLPFTAMPNEDTQCPF